MVVYLHESGTYVLRSAPTSGSAIVRENVQAALARSMQADPGVPNRAMQEALVHQRRHPR